MVFHILSYIYFAHQCEINQTHVASLSYSSNRFSLNDPIYLFLRAILCSIGFLYLLGFSRGRHVLPRLRDLLLQYACAFDNFEQS